MYLIKIYTEFRVSVECCFGLVAVGLWFTAGKKLRIEKSWLFLLSRIWLAMTVRMWTCHDLWYFFVFRFCLGHACGRLLESMGYGERIELLDWLIAVFFFWGGGVKLSHRPILFLFKLALALGCSNSYVKRKKKSPPNSQVVSVLM